MKLPGNFKPKQWKTEAEGCEWQDPYWDRYLDAADTALASKQQWLESKVLIANDSNHDAVFHDQMDWVVSERTRNLSRVRKHKSPIVPTLMLTAHTQFKHIAQIQILWSFHCTESFKEWHKNVNEKFDVM